MSEASADARPVSRLIWPTFVYGVGGAMNRGVSLLLLPVLTRFLTPSEYGISAILEVLSACLFAVFSLGIGSSLTVSYYDARDPSARERVVSTALLLLVASALAMVAVGTLGLGAISRWTLGDVAHADLVLLSLGVAAALVLRRPLRLQLQFQERAGRLATLEFVSTVLVIGFSLVGVVALERGVRGLWEGRLVAHVLAFLLFAAHFPVRRWLAFERPVARELLAIGLPMIPAVAALFVLVSGNRYILSFFASLEVVGVYTVGVQVGMVTGIAVTAFSSAWTPYFMSYLDRRDAAPAAFKRVMTWYVLGMGGLSLAAFALARPALLILTPREFHDGFAVVGLAATSQMLIGVFNVMLPACTFAKELPQSSGLRLIAAAVAIGLNLLLIPWLGLTGAGLALALGTGGMAALLWYWNRWRGEVYLQVRYDARRLLPFWAFYACCAALLTRDRAWGPGAEVALAGVALVAIASVVWLLLPAEDRSSAVRALRRLPGRAARASGGAVSGARGRRA